MRVKKVARVFLTLIVIVLLVVLGGEAFLNFYLAKRLNTYIETKINSEPQRKYHLSIGSSGLSLFGRSFYARNVLLLPDTNNSGKQKMFSFSTDEFKLEGISLISLFFRDELKISELNLDRPQIKVYDSTDKPDPASEGFGIYSLIKDKYRSLFISSVSINNAGVILYEKKERLNSDRNLIEVRNFLVNESTDKQGKLFFAEDVRISMERFSYHLSDLYSISGKNLFASYKDSLMRVDSLRLVPRYSKQNFGKVSGVQSRVLLSTGRLELNGADVAAFIERNELRSSGAIINSLLISVHLDKNVDFVATEKPSLQKILRNIPVPLKVDSVIIRNSDIIYEHLPPGGKIPGKLSFNRLEASIKGLNNSDTLSSTKSKLTLNAECLFMNKSTLNVSYIFPMNTVKEEFECKGILKPMDLRAINPVLENVAFMSVKSGMLDQFRFSFRANEHVSDGLLKFYYHDLDFDVKDKENSFNTGRKILFMAAKAFFINRSNPGRNGKPGVTKIHFDRYPKKYFFYYTWKSLQSGIMDALGIRSTSILHRSDDK